jgi:hypothetical protein
MRTAMRRMLTAALMYVTLAPWAPARGTEVDGWAAIGPYGGDVERLVRSPAPSSRIFVTTFPHAYLTTDGGTTWSRMAATPAGCQPGAWQGYLDDGPAVHVGWIAPTGPVALRVLCNFENLGRPSDGSPFVSRVLESTDGGASWSVLLQEPGVFTALAVDAADPSRMVAYARASGVFDSMQIVRYATTNGGATWQSSLVGTCIAPGSGVQAAAFHGGALYEWRAFCQQPQPGPGSFGGLWRRDGGQETFLSSLVELSTGGASVPLGGTRIIPDGDRLYVQRNGRLGRSDDGGTTWQVVRTGVTSTDVAPSRRVWATGPDWIAYSDDGGASFVPVSTGAADTPSLRALRALAVTTGSYPLVGGAFGVHGRGPAAAQWTKADRGMLDAGATAFDVSADGLTIIAVSDDAGAYPVTRSFDGGLTWQAPDATARIARGRSIASVAWPTPSGRRIVVAGSSCFDDGPGCANAATGGPGPGLYYSDDEGTTFQAYPGLPDETGPDALRLQRHVVATARPGGGAWLYAGGASRSSAWSAVRGDGNAWLPSSGLPADTPDGRVEVMQLAIDAATAGRAYLGTLGFLPYDPPATASASGVFRSDDEGASWVERSAGLPWYGPGSSAHESVYAIEADALRGGRVWASTQAGTAASSTSTPFRSVDAADSWQRCGALPAGTSVRDFATIPGRPNTLLAADAGAFTYTPGGVWISEDACRTWTRIGAERARFVLTRGNTLMAGTASGVLRRAYTPDVLLFDDFD